MQYVALPFMLYACLISMWSHHMFSELVHIWHRTKKKMAKKSCRWLNWRKSSPNESSTQHINNYSTEGCEHNRALFVCLKFTICAVNSNICQILNLANNYLQVLSHYQEDLLTMESFGKFCNVMGKSLHFLSAYTWNILMWSYTFIFRSTWSCEKSWCLHWWINSLCGCCSIDIKAIYWFRT